MDAVLWISIGILQIVLLVSVVVIYIIYKRVSQEGVDQLREVVSNLERTMKEDMHSALDAQDKRVLKLEEEMNRLDSKGKRNTELFATVLHGFDFIVQGCKNALTSGEMDNINPDLLKDVKSLQEKKENGAQEKKDRPLYESIPLKEQY